MIQHNLPNYPWIVRTTGHELSGSFNETVLSCEPVSTESLEEEVIHFKSLEDVGYYCVTGKGFKKAMWSYLHSVLAGDPDFEAYRRFKPDILPKSYPCVVQFSADKGRILFTTKISRTQILALRTVRS